MRSDHSAGQAPPLAASAQARWARLTDEDLAHADGNYDALVDVISRRYGCRPERAAQEVDEWLQLPPRDGAPLAGSVHAPRR